MKEPKPKLRVKLLGLYRVTHQGEEAGCLSGPTRYSAEAKCGDQFIAASQTSQKLADIMVVQKF